MGSDFGKPCPIKPSVSLGVTATWKYMPDIIYFTFLVHVVGVHKYKWLIPSYESGQYIVCVMTCQWHLKQSIHNQ